MLVCTVLWPVHAQSLGGNATTPAQWRTQFEQAVDHRINIPLPEQQTYISLLEHALAQAGITDTASQAYVLVDRSPQIQAAIVLLRLPTGAWWWLGATAISTGKVGTFEHFRTPLGVFPHTLDNPDYRAEGTFNKNHIRGYGVQGKRVFDLGWQQGERGWGNGGVSPLRLQMHATDPDRLEPRLGTVQSEGCIRIPATLNTYLDQHGVLDADYDEAIAEGQDLWMIESNRQTINWPGRYVVVVDSNPTVRPAWAALPTKPRRVKK